MSRPGWDNAAWEQISDYERFWTPFDAAFHFRPGMDPATWPGIVEPSGSLTFDLGPLFSRDGGFAADEDALNALTLAAITTVFAAGTKLVALDWQHPSYWFWPHRQAASSEPWRIPRFQTAITTSS